MEQFGQLTVTAHEPMKEEEKKVDGADQLRQLLTRAGTYLTKIMRPFKGGYEKASRE